MSGATIHVVLASDANYLPGLEVTRRSMIAACSDPDRLKFHVFDEHALEGCDTSGLRKWNSSLMPYLRLWLPQLLPGVDRVIYSDVDTIWNRDVCELWDMDISAAIGWVRDMQSMRSEACGWIARAAKGEGVTFDWTRYACSGVCVLNLTTMRRIGFTELVLGLYSKYGVPKFPDQDVLNFIFNHDSVLLPSVWGAMGDCSNLPKGGERCVYHLTGAGRHFHDQTPPTYPPQYQMWWLAYAKLVKGTCGGDLPRPPFRTRLLSLLWPLHPLARFLPLSLRERVVRQWFFARELVRG